MLLSTVLLSQEVYILSKFHARAQVHEGTLHAEVCTAYADNLFSIDSIRVSSVDVCIPGYTGVYAAI